MIAWRRARSLTLLLAALATIVCVRAALPTSSHAESTTGPVWDQQNGTGSVSIMVSISGPQVLASRQTAWVGTAVHLAADGEAIEGTTVVLDRRNTGTSQWLESGRALTDARGRAVFSVPVVSSTDFRTRALPDPHYARASSAVITVVTR